MDYNNWGKFQYGNGRFISKGRVAKDHFLLLVSEKKNDIDTPRIHHEALCRLDEHKSISEKKCYVEVKVDGVTYHVYFNKVEGGWVPEKTERK